MGEAVGIIEVFGLATAFAAADAGCKAANVTIENFDKNKPANADALPVPLIVMIKFRGTISDVRAAGCSSQTKGGRTGRGSSHPRNSQPRSRHRKNA